MTITAIVVDDEPHAAQALSHLLGSYPQVTIVATCENGITAVKAVHELKPNVMFLDIHMPKLDGFDVLELLGNTRPLVVFVTAHDDYAIQAFENNALDYLLKPVNRARIETTIDRLEQRLSTLLSENSLDATTDINTEKLLQNHVQRQAPVTRILVREKGDVFVIPSSDILAIEAADDYVVIHTPTKNHIKQERLNNLESILDPQQFCRIHRSAIINLDYLHGIETEGKDSRFATLNNKKQFAISRSGYARLIKVL